MNTILRGGEDVIVGYAVLLLLSVLLMIGYFALVRHRSRWLSLLFVSVTVVNGGYLALSLAPTLTLAIIANDRAYLGSVFLMMCMLLAVMELCGFRVRRALWISLVALAVLMYALILTSGLLPWYYSALSIDRTEGFTRLVKEYGPLHGLYTVYVLAYFAAMIAVILISLARRRVGSYKQAGLLTAMVCGNILVWVLEKQMHSRFEFLSISYVFSELLLVFLYWMIEDYTATAPAPHERDERELSRLLARLPEGETLTQREREVLIHVLENHARKEIALAMCLSENTVKTYTRTLYAKLGVASRNELYALLGRE